MAGRQLPGLGLKGDWALGEDNWKDENDLNLLTLSVLTQGRVLALQPLETDPPTQGDIVILDDTHATHANAIAVYDEGAWLYIAAGEGMMMWNLDDSIRYEFKAGAWAELSAGFDDAPVDGTLYGRKDGAWEEITEGGGGGGGGTAYNNVLYVAAMAEISNPAAPVLDRQHNIASVTRTATGRYRITFATPMPDTDYDVFLTGRLVDAATDVSLSIAIDRRAGQSRATTHCDVTVHYTAATSAALTDAATFYRFTILRRQNIVTETAPAHEVLLANVKLTAEGTFPVINTAGFRSVRIVFNLKKGGADSDITAASFRFNGANTGYYTKNMYAAGGGAGVGSDAHALNAAQGPFALISTRSAANTKLSAGGEVVITGLDNATLNKNWSASNAAYRVSDGSVFNYTVRGFWDNVAVVNSIQIMETFAVDSSIQVFGVRSDAMPNPSGAIIPGDVVLLEERVISAPTATVDFIGLITDAYRDYEIEISNLVFSANEQLFMRYSQDNGATFDASAIYTSAGVMWNQGNFGAQSQDGTNNTRFRLSSTDWVGSANAAASLTVTLHNPLNTTGPKGIKGLGSGMASDGNTYVRLVGGRYASNNAVNAFRLYPATGTINSGVIRIYGKRKVGASANVSVTAGGAFPPGPAIGARFYRTDRKIEYFWDGTRWLSTQLMSATFASTVNFADTAAATLPVPFLGQYGIWLERFEAAVFRSAAGEWDIILERRTAANAITAIATLDGAGDATTTFVNKVAALGAVLDPSAVALTISMSEISGASLLNVGANLHYRLIG